ncbi:MAG TPA: HD domain-containing protein [Thermoanaerobaculia bacterium]|nr:HD domain-containing protein [Thermoanaerobaculia bacterium]
MTTPPISPRERIRELAAERLARQLDFVIEIDRLKTVLRRTDISDGSRLENSAEHSWHISVMALLLAEYAGESLDITRVLEMLLVHDIVEVDAGDTFCYDAAANHDREEREQRAAERLFGLLPSDQAERFRARWDEFEARATPEARFAAALDRLEPVLLNYVTAGGSWRRHAVDEAQVRIRNRPIGDGAAELWDIASRLIADAADRGWLGSGERER